MRYLLDTNVCIDYLNGRYPTVTARIQESPPADLCLSSVVVAELRYGADKSAHKRRNHARVDALLVEIPCFDFDLDAARVFGRLRAALEAEGAPIGPYDMLIAAHALSRGHVLITGNVQEFSRVGNLRVESWRE